MVVLPNKISVRYLDTAVDMREYVQNVRVKLRSQLLRIKINKVHHMIKFIVTKTLINVIVFG